MIMAPREASRGVGCAMVSEGDGDPGGVGCAMVSETDGDPGGGNYYK